MEQVLMQNYLFSSGFMYVFGSVVILRVNWIDLFPGWPVDYWVGSAYEAAL
jgi:hypothetical protein